MPTKPKPQCKASTYALGARIWMAILGLSLCLMGSVGGGYLWLSFQKARRCDQWIERPATVIVSMIDNSDRTQHNDIRYRLEIYYRYEFAGNKHLSSKVKLLPIASRDQRKIIRWQQRYPVGKETTCFVNPEAPSIAILHKPTKAAIYSIWFPSLLVVFGLKIIFGIFPTKAKENR